MWGRRLLQWSRTQAGGCGSLLLLLPRRTSPVRPLVAGRLCAKLDLEALGGEMPGQRGGFVHALEELRRKHLKQLRDGMRDLDDTVPVRASVSFGCIALPRQAIGDRWLSGNSLSCLIKGEFETKHTRQTDRQLGEDAQSSRPAVQMAQTLGSLDHLASSSVRTRRGLDGWVDILARLRIGALLSSNERGADEE